MTGRDVDADLGYVRGLIRESDRRPSPSAIYLLWAVLAAVGFILADFAPAQLGWYWAVAGPAGGIASGVLGARYQRARGQLNRALGIRHALHWGGMLVAIAMCVLLAQRGIIGGEHLSKVILLVVAFGWWVGGVHFDRIFMWLGAAMLAGFLAMLWVDRYVWTGLGVVMAAVLIERAWSTSRRDRSHEP